MAKKTRKKNPTTPELVSLATQVLNLFNAQTDGDEERLNDMIRDKLAVSRTLFESWLSGEQQPTESKADLLRSLLEANADTPAGSEPKKRTEPNAAEVKRLLAIEAVAELTSHPAWASLVKSINAKDKALTESLRDCKPNELRGIQGQIEALDWLRSRVTEPAEEFAAMPLFAQSHVVKVDREAMQVTVSQRGKA